MKFSKISGKQLLIGIIRNVWPFVQKKKMPMLLYAKRKHSSNISLEND